MWRLFAISDNILFVLQCLLGSALNPDTTVIRPRCTLNGEFSSSKGVGLFYARVICVHSNCKGKNTCAVSLWFTQSRIVFMWLGYRNRLYFLKVVLFWNLEQGLIRIPVSPELITGVKCSIRYISRCVEFSFRIGTVDGQEKL